MLPARSGTLADAANRRTAKGGPGGEGWLRPRASLALLLRWAASARADHRVGMLSATTAQREARVNRTGAV